MMTMNRHRSVGAAPHATTAAAVANGRRDGGRCEWRHRWCPPHRRAYALMTSTPAVAVVTCLVTFAVCSHVMHPRSAAAAGYAAARGMGAWRPVRATLRPSTRAGEAGHGAGEWGPGRAATQRPATSGPRTQAGDAGPGNGEWGAGYHGDMAKRPVLFVGGCPRSGTTLMRVILDSHPQVFCGEETRVIPDLLGLIRKWSMKGRERARQAAAGVTETIVDNAARNFIWSVLLRHQKKESPSSNLLCAKDPMTLRHIAYVSRLFPASRFLLLLRDGRAVADSIVTRKIRISAVNISSYASTLRFWQMVTARMLDECNELGSGRCRTVRYEDLVSTPEKTIRSVVAFLGLPWSPDLLKHQEHVAAGDIRISKLEPSSSQVSKSIYTSAIDSWRQHFPRDVLQKATDIAPLLLKLGYVKA